MIILEPYLSLKVVLIKKVAIIDTSIYYIVGTNCTTYIRSKKKKVKDIV